MAIPLVVFRIQYFSLEKINKVGNKFVIRCDLIRNRFSSLFSFVRNEN